ncbi:MAG: Uma2 family endonuclease [Thermodesulfobacteriota bacterium]|nr:Uma2 family endonuclease [Thermodesulfobacteriota bacterium]
MNVQPQEKNHMTPEEYLEFDRTSDIKYEYFEGEIFAMTGAKKNHNLINTSITVNLVNKMGNSECRVFSNDMRVKIENKSGFAYPDIAIACGDLEFEDNEFDTLTNPIVIIEILSDSTELYDRTEKFTYYRAISTLQEYILVSQNKCRVERFVRKEGGMWGMFHYECMEQIIKIESIDCEMSLSDIYQWVEFENGTVVTNR